MRCRTFGERVGELFFPQHCVATSSVLIAQHGGLEEDVWVEVELWLCSRVVFCVKVIFFSFGLDWEGAFSSLPPSNRSTLVLQPLLVHC